jgi:hypothetical protein
MSEVSLYGLRPRARLGAWPPLLSQNDKDGCRGLPESTGSKQPKAPNSVLIGLPNVLGPTLNELFQGAPNLTTTTLLFVFEPKPDASFPDPGDTTLRDGRPSYVAAGVLQEMPFVLERLSLDVPPASLQMNEQVFHLVNGQLRPKLTRLQGCAEKRDHGLPPRRHQQMAIVVDARNPNVGRPVQPSPGDHCVYMGVEL